MEEMIRERTKKMRTKTLMTMNLRNYAREGNMEEPRSYEEQESRSDKEQESRIDDRPRSRNQHDRMNQVLGERFMRIDVQRR